MNNVVSHAITKYWLQFQLAIKMVALDHHNQALKRQLCHETKVVTDGALTMRLNTICM